VADPDIRASDVDRQRAVDQLRHHLGDGRLSIDEFEERAAQAYAARTVADLSPVLADLPVVRAGGGPPVRDRRRESRPRPMHGPLASTAYRIHLYTWPVLSLFWIVIWLATGADGSFWPIYPIAGYGLSVGLHASVRKALE
jgi:hypothetical protein